MDGYAAISPSETVATSSQRLPYDRKTSADRIAFLYPDAFT